MKNKFQTYQFLFFSAFAALILYFPVGVQYNLAMGYHDQQITVTEADNNSKIQLKTGDTLILKLKAKPGTGYSWKLSDDFSQYLEQIGKSEYEDIKKKEGKIGSEEYQVFRFQAVEKGLVKLKLDYIRPWEKTKAPEKSFVLTVDIK